MKSPMPVSSWNFWPYGPALDTWSLRTDNPYWGNNAEATTSSGYKRPRLELIGAALVHESKTALNSGQGHETGQEQQIVPYCHSFAVRQILNNLHPQVQSPTHQAEQWVQENNFQMEVDMDEEQLSEAVMEDPVEGTILGIASPGSGQKKRKAKAKTPIVDDEVRRSIRFKKNEARKHVQLDREPRRRKGESKKTVYFSTVEDLKAAIVSKSLDEDLEEVEMIEPIQAVTLVGLGNSFCGVPPEEMTLATLSQDEE